MSASSKLVTCGIVDVRAWPCWRRSSCESASSSAGGPGPRCPCRRRRRAARPTGATAAARGAAGVLAHGGFDVVLGDAAVGPAAGDDRPGRRPARGRAAAWRDRPAASCRRRRLRLGSGLFGGGFRPARPWRGAWLRLRRRRLRRRLRLAALRSARASRLGLDRRRASSALARRSSLGGGCCLAVCAPAAFDRQQRIADLDLGALLARGPW